MSKGTLGMLVDSSAFLDAHLSHPLSTQWVQGPIERRTEQTDGPLSVSKKKTEVKKNV